MRTFVYIDGFNLYYGALKSTGFKWLDLRVLATVLFPNDDIQRVCYFTARVKPRPNDPAQPQRQQVYLRALRTLDQLDIYFGDFRERKKWLPLVRPTADGDKFAEVIKPEEKGTDVNLATRLLVDGFTSGYQHAVVVSNDSDLATPMRYVKDELGLKVSVVNPSKSPTHHDLVNAATYVKKLRPNHLRASQFAPTINDTNGTITKPSSW